MNSLAKNSASYVQPNSVQSQFAALTRDRERFRQEMQAAERDSKRALERLQSLKKEQVSLMAKIQTSQEGLGDLSRKHAMLKQETARLKRVMKTERQALQDCANHTAGLVKKEEEATKKFCLEIASLNDETASFLHKQVVDKMVKFVSIESVETILTGNLPANANKEVFEEKLARMKSAFARYQNASKNPPEMGYPILQNNDQTQKAAFQAGSTTQRHLDIFYGPESSNEN